MQLGPDAKELMVILEWTQEYEMKKTTDAFS
jgi:hypothetical protein